MTTCSPSGTPNAITKPVQTTVLKLLSGSSRLRPTLLVGLVVVVALLLPVDLAWLAEAMIGAWLLWLCTRPSWLEVLVMALLAAGLYAARVALDPGTAVVVFALKRRFGYFAGWAGILLLARRSPSPAFTSALALPLFILVRYLGLVAFVPYAGPTLDGKLYLLDHALGDPAYHMAGLFYTSPRSISYLWVLYRAFIWMLPLAVGATLGEPISRRRILLAWMLAGVLSVPCYVLLPASGPAYAFPPWPSMPNPASVRWAALEAQSGWIRNAMPSLHFAWALLTWLLAPPDPRWLRPAMLAFVGVTFVTTLSLGQHWLVDLIAALPFTAVVAWVTRTLVPNPLQPEV